MPPAPDSSTAIGPKQVAPAGAPDASRAMTLFVLVVATLYFGREVLVPVVLARSNVPACLTGQPAR